MFAFFKTDTFKTIIRAEIEANIQKDPRSPQIIKDAIIDGKIVYNQYEFQKECGCVYAHLEPGVWHDAMERSQKITESLMNKYDLLLLHEQVISMVPYSEEYSPIEILIWGCNQMTDKDSEELALLLSLVEEYLPGESVQKLAQNPASC